MAAAAGAAALGGSSSEDPLGDWQQQVDEVQALEAIFGPDFHLLDASGLAGSGGGPSGSGSSSAAAAGDDDEGAGRLPQHAPLDAAALALLGPPLSCSDDSAGGSASGGWALDCSLLVQMEPPGGSLRLLLPPEAGAGDGSSGDAAAAAADAAAAGGGGSAGEGGGGYRVRHLPPICLQLRLGPGYPSACAPEVGLTATWLSSRQAAELEGQLAALWAEQGPGAPVVYSWADWLQSSALAHLGAADALALEAEPASSGGGGGQDAAAAEAADEAEEGGGLGAGGGDAEGGAEAVLMRLLR